MSNEKYHVFKLNNGEDVICKLIKATDEYYEYVVAKMDNMKSEDWGKLPSPEQLLEDEMPSDAFDEYDSTEEWQDLYGDLLRKKTIH